MPLYPARNLNYINVKDYGAVGNGTTDDATTINTAIANSPVGSTIFFPGNHAVGSTIIFKANRTYLGPTWLTQATPTFLQMNGKNLPAVVASDEWYNNSAVSGYPITLKGIMVDANSANNTTSHGIVVMNFDSILSECSVQNVPGVGIKVTSKSRNGTSISNTCVETRVEKCKVLFTGSYGIYAEDSSGALTDGYIENCLVESPSDTAIRVEYAAGWFIRQNHLYGCATSAIYAHNCWATHIQDNEIDGFGSAAGTPAGMDIALNGPRATIIEGNIIALSNESPEANSYTYLSVQGNSTFDTKAIVVENTIQGGWVSTSSTSTVTAGTTNACTPLSMAGIHVGQTLWINFVDNITVGSITATSFTPSATWPHTYGPTSFTINSSKSAGLSLGLVYTSSSTQQSSGNACTLISFGNRVDAVGTYDFFDSYTTVGPVAFDGTIALTAPPASSIQTLATGNTITTLGLGAIPVTTSGNVTGIILQKGTQNGQIITVMNESANTITFAASGTSHVADGASDVINGNVGATFCWDAHAGAWIRC